MKNCLLMLALLSATALAAQPNTNSKLDNCDNLVVWKFSCESDLKLAEHLTFEIEAILTDIKPGCRVLERRRYATLNEIIEQEGAKENIKKTSKRARTQLAADAARTVMFGKILRDDAISGGTRIEIEIDDLSGEKLKSDFILLSAEEMLPAVRRENLRPFIHKIVGAAAVAPRNKDTRWDTASRGDTKESYERYLRWCQSGGKPCLHESEARKIIADETEWQRAYQPLGDKKQINALCRYLEKGNTRHEEQAKRWLGNLMDDQRKRNTRGWILGGGGVVLGAVAIVVGSEQVSQGDDLYNNTYAKYDDDFDPVYADKSRADVKDEADFKKTFGRYLQIGGSALVIAGAWCIVNRFKWQKTLQRGNELVVTPCIASPFAGYAFAPAGAGNGIAICLSF